jgi:hypothetical protein
MVVPAHTAAPFRERCAVPAHTRDYDDRYWYRHLR